MASAMYEEAIGRARKALEKLEFDVDKLAPFVDAIKRESETGQVLIFCSYLDDRIKHLLALHMRHLKSKEDWNKLFGARGPLDTFSSRVLVAYHLGWISEHSKQQIDALRKVRNEFAHRAFEVTTSDPAIQRLLRQIDQSKPMFDALEVAFPEIPSVDLRSMAKNTTLCHLVLLAGQVFGEILVWPLAIRHQVHPGGVAGNWENMPKGLKKLRKEVARSVLIASDLEALAEAVIVGRDDPKDRLDRS
jgi:hypothetical protein